MTDTLSPKLRSQRMSLVKASDTKPEMIVRRLVHALGFRYRLHVRGLPGTPDLVFSRLRKVIFIHGCFWHRHRHRFCKLARMPKSRLDFWETKLEGNRLRDLKNKRLL
ncbi:MAG: DNA mismatch endonuclease Vsr, partial [Acidobacteria bacterium]|nr:DNA mismatch endonuclease Vsr [Acidobacteriota bacterium]